MPSVKWVTINKEEITKRVKRKCKSKPSAEVDVVQELAHITNTGESTVKEWLRKGLIPGYKYEAVEAWLTSKARKSPNKNGIVKKKVEEVKVECVKIKPEPVQIDIEDLVPRTEPTPIYDHKNPTSFLDLSNIDRLQDAADILRDTPEKVALFCICSKLEEFGEMPFYEVIKLYKEEHERMEEKFNYG